MIKLLKRFTNSSSSSATFFRFAGVGLTISTIDITLLYLLKEIDFESDLYDSTYVDSASYRFLQDRTKGLNNAEKKELLLTYARPLINKEKARLASGP